MQTKTRPTFTIVVETSDWRIERDRASGDFNAYVAGAGYIGSRPSQREAQKLINDYRYQTMTRAPEQLADGDIEDGEGPGGIDLYAAAFDDDDQPDCPERGLVDTVPIADVNWNSAPVCACGAEATVYPFSAAPAPTLCYACALPAMTVGMEPPDLTNAKRLAQSLANTTKSPICVVREGEKFYIRDAADLACYGSTTIVATYQPRDDDDRVDVENEPESPPVYPAPNGRAHTLQSIAIEARLTVCGYCQGIHHIQACPSLLNAVFTKQWVGADLGRGLCQMRWRNHAGFVELLLQATPARLVEYALSYQAFIKTQKPDSDLTINDVLISWRRAMGRTPSPAGMAMHQAAA